MNSDETNLILSEILKWQKLQGVQILRKLMPILLDNKNKKTVYEITDGKNSVKEIKSKTGLAEGTISLWWQEWYANGILLKEGKKYKKIISITELKI